MMNPVALSFIFFLLIFVLIGAYAARLKKSTTEDYLLAGRSVGPWATALSAVASNNSCFMFIGLCMMLIMRWQLAFPMQPLPWIGELFG